MTTPPLPRPAADVLDWSHPPLTPADYKKRGNAYLYKTIALWDKPEEQKQLCEQAIREYQYALRLDPNYTDALYNLGRAYDFQGNRPAAAASYRRILALNPNDHPARVRLGNTLRRMGQIPEAMAQYRYVLQVAPTFAMAIRNLLRTDEATLAEPEAVVQERVKAQAHALMQVYYQQTRQSKLLKLLEDTRFEFAKFPESSRMAEYDHTTQTIRFKSILALSPANVLAAYGLHEMQHRLDGDSASSIQEEYDGFANSACFWERFGGNVVEPQLDDLVTAFQQGALRSQIEEAYRDDPAVKGRRVSPGHGEERDFHCQQAEA